MFDINDDFEATWCSCSWVQKVNGQGLDIGWTWVMLPHFDTSSFDFGASLCLVSVLWPP